MIVVPVQSDLRLITVAPDGSVSQRVLSQVRYSDLEVRPEGSILHSATCSAFDQLLFSSFM